MIFCSTAFADYTTDYEFTAPNNKSDMDYSQGSYNVIGNIKVSKKAADSDKNFDPLKKVVITANYSDKFESSSTSANVKYKLCTGATKAEAKDLPSGDEIVFSGDSINSGTAEINLACYIEDDTSSLPDGYYFSKPKFTHKIKNPKVGDIVNFGKFNGSPLSWLILDVDEKNNRALLITENCVVKQKFADSNYEWATSSVRAYLNGTDGDNFFTSSNFTDDEKARILNVLINKTTLSKKSNQIVKSYGTDFVFLLSVKDANEYFENDSKRVCKFDNSNCRWWLRMSTQSYAKAGYVSSQGKVFPDGTLVSYNTLGVRPAIWIQLSRDDSTDAAEFESEIGFTISSTDSVTTDGKSILEMSEDEIKEKYENKSNIVITGTVDSAELAEILEKIGKVTLIENLDLREITVSEIKLDDVNIWNINLEGNANVKKVEIKNSAVVSLNLSKSAVEEIEANNCEILETVTLEDCKEIVKVNFSETALAKLVVKGCEALTALSCESSDLKNLDIDGCQKLEKLNVKNNSLPKLRISKTNFPSLTEFSCENQKITSKLSQSFNLNNFLQSLVISSATAADTSELDNIKNIKGYDTSNNELSYELNKETGEIKFSEEPYTLTYDYNTGFEDILMDVNISISNGEKWGAGDGENLSDEENSLSSSGSGCNSGFGFMILGLLLNLTRKKFTKK